LQDKNAPTAIAAKGIGEDDLLEFALGMTGTGIFSV
jgi:hypothetical protein